MLVLELALVCLILVSAILVAAFRDPIGATAVFAAFSLGMALVWALLAAPDVALTEAAVGAGVMVILLLVAAVRTSRDQLPAYFEDGPALRPLNRRAVIVIGGLIIPLTYSVLSFPRVGDVEAPGVSETDPTGKPSPYAHYIGDATADLGISNAVGAVLVVFRSLDTLGEVIVVFTGLIGVLIVLARSVSITDFRTELDSSIEYPDPTVMSPVGSTAVRLVVPLVFVFGVYLITVGTTLPGGGFQGGVVVGATFVLMGLIFGSVPTAQWTDKRVVAWGIVIAILVFISYLLWSSWPGETVGGDTRLAVPPHIVVEVIEVAIGVLVGAVVLTLVYAMAFGVYEESRDDRPDTEETTQ